MKWAKCNLGSTVPEAAGLYFSWGNIEGKPNGSSYTWSQEVYNQTPGAEIETNIPLNNDAAHVALGDKWRIPTKANFQELVTNCNYEAKRISNKNGLLFTSKINGNQIFMPCAGFFYSPTRQEYNQGGHYLSSSIISATEANCLVFYSSGASPAGTNQRRMGLSIRPVFDPNL